MSHCKSSDIRERICDPWILAVITNLLRNGFFAAIKNLLLNGLRKGFSRPLAKFKHLKAFKNQYKIQGFLGPVQTLNIDI